VLLILLSFILYVTLVVVLGEEAQVYALKQLLSHTN
jgi:hypothetical protein